jgi:hypothetical protein
MVAIGARVGIVDLLYEMTSSVTEHLRRAYAWAGVPSNAPTLIRIVAARNSCT